MVRTHRRQGRLALASLPEGSYTLRIWHPRIADTGPQLERTVQLSEGPTDPVTIRLTRKLKPALHNHGTDQRWDDY